MKNKCNVIRDILPLYVEKMVSQETAEFVEEHLQSCSECNDFLDNMCGDAGGLLECGGTEKSNDVLPLKKIKRQMNRQKVLTILLTSLASLAVLLSVFFLLSMHGLPTNSENILVETEFQYCKGVYLDQAFVIHIISKNGSPLYVSVNDMYEEDAKGNKKLVGYEIVPREAIINFRQNPPRFTMGFSPSDLEDFIPDDGFDFIIRVKCNDKNIDYSMAEEGALVPQEDLVQRGALEIAE